MKGCKSLEVVAFIRIDQFGLAILNTVGSSEAQSHDQYVFQNCIPAPMGKEN